jgi:hypothetical protein
VDALIPLIFDANKAVRVNTGIALSVYGPDAASALPHLQVMAKESDPSLSAIALAAVQAIKGISKPDKEEDPSDTQ